MGILGGRGILNTRVGKRGFILLSNIFNLVTNNGYDYGYAGRKERFYFTVCGGGGDFRYAVEKSGFYIIV